MKDSVIKNNINNKNGAYSFYVDYAKLFCCVLIVGAHCRPLFSQDILNYYYGQWFFRLSVPFFFISSGYFFSKMNGSKRQKYIKRIAVIYAGSLIIYSPSLMADDLRGLINDIVFGYYHLWYLSALFFGLIAAHLLEKAIKEYRFFFILLLVAGVLFDEYYKLLGSSVLNRIAECVDLIGTARHALFFGLPLILIGECLSKREWKNTGNSKLLLLLAVTLAFGFFEATAFRRAVQGDVSLDVSIFGWTPAVPLFLLAIGNKPKRVRFNTRKLRRTVDFVYIVHIYVIAVLKDLFAQSHFSLLFFTLLISFAVSYFVLFLAEAIKKLIKNVRKKSAENLRQTD